MSKQSADYDKKKVTNLNEFYPTNLKNDFIDGLNETVFNRFLTKQDYDRIVGAIGDEDLSSSIRNILERDSFAQDNQLQPVLTTKIGSASAFLTWQDFMRRLEQQDVDVSNYDAWGAVTQFNWVPPIDLDKFINFRDYYWDTTLYGIADPDYVTIKNRTVSRALRLQQMTKTVSDVLLEGRPVTNFVFATSTVSVAGNVPTDYPQGLDVIIKYVDGSYELTRVTSSVFNVLTSQTDIVLAAAQDKAVYSIVSTSIPATRDASIENVLYVNGGDYTNIFTTDYIFSATDSYAALLNYSKVISSVYDAAQNRTVVTSSVNFPSTIASVSLAPMLLLALYETTYEGGYVIEQPYSIDSFYKILWMVRKNKVSSSFGFTSVAQNTLGDNTVNFVAAGVAIGDTLEIVTPSGTKVRGIITSVSTNQIGFATNDTPYIFSFSGLSYSVYSKLDTTDFMVEPTSPVDGDIWFDSTTDTVKCRELGVWVDKCKNFSILYGAIADRKIVYSDNAWTLTNSWVHKTQISAVAGKIRAQAPILEFSDALQLSDITKVDHDWSYRPTEDVSYVSSSVHPTNFELFNIQRTGAEIEFGFPNLTTVVFASKYGNLTDGIVEGSKIVLSGFTENDGVYEVETCEYTQLTPSSNAQTVVTLKQQLSSTTDNPVGATIKPLLTSVGDEFVSPYVNWRYDGVNNIYSTSQKPKKNPIYGTILNSSTTSKNGFNWQSYSFVTGAQTDPTLQFAAPLHSYCLYDDYQEGDIRVYINKQRQYGNFIELPSYIDDRYVGGIQFVGGVQLTENDVVVVEVGEYAESDAGRKAVVVNTASGYELTNLSRYKKHEQIKSSSSQYPEFVVVDSLTKLPHRTSSKIFSYVEDLTKPINPYVKKKLALKDSANGSSFVFQQHLLDGTATLAYQYLTVDGITSRTIWRVGANYEKYVPTKNADGTWEIPNNWYYNPHHENREQNSYIDLYTHFRSIIQAQRQPGLPADIVNSYYSDWDINYGLGGTIKEHNGNLDILASSVFNESGSVEQLIEFAKKQYSNSLHTIQSIYLANAPELFWAPAANSAELVANIAASVIDKYEEDSKYSYWFGDSSAYDGSDGVRNWILTLPMMGLVRPVKPYKIVDSNKSIYQIVHHDGHRSDVSLTPAVREQLLARILAGREHASDVVTSDLQPFPTTIGSRSVVVGDYLLRTNTTARTRTLYRFNGSDWDKVSLTETLMDCVLEVERRLYNVAIKKYNGQVYDFDALTTNAKFGDKIQKQFSKFAASSNVVEPLSNKDRFSQNNPFTWNYYLSVPTTLPTTATFVAASDWRQLYQNVFGTPYPHLEPWKMQGYVDKPDWWDVEYYTSGTYSQSMWQNVLNGVVPAGRELPNGNTSTGATEVATYTYLPVVTIASTPDGYSYGDLLPPYWNSVNNNGVNTIRSIFDPNSGDEIISPSLDFVFGQYGDFEYIWRTSLDYNYDLMVVAFKLDPLNFISNTFGYKKYLSGCLELHAHSKNIQPGNRTVFHGEEYNDGLLEVLGLNQWYVNYNRYQGFDSTNSDFNAIWKNSSMKLSYLFDSLIDSKTLDIRSNIFDLTDKDYSVLLKTTKDLEIKTIDAINLTLIAAPSRFLGDVDKGWTFELSTIPEVKNEIKYFGVQNYEVGVSGNTMTVFSDTLTGIQYTPSRDYVKISYNNTLKLNTSLGLLIGNTYSASISVNGNTYNVEVTGDDASTVAELLDFINEQIEGAYVDLELGDIVVYATAPASVISVTDVDLFSTLPNFASVGLQTATDAKFENIFEIRGNKTTKYTPSTVIEIVNSTIFNGTYTVTASSYNPSTDITSIEVKENVAIPNGGLLVDGNVSIVGDLGLPDSWITGTEIYFNSYDTVTGISLERPYYVIRLTDTTFSIAETATAAINNRALDLSGITIRGSLYAGRLERTFKANGGAATKINWRIHAIDDRVVRGVFDGVSITGMQNTVDWLHGYSMYNDSVGFGLSNVYKDAETGRPYSWDLYIEKFIDWAFTTRGTRQQTKLEYKVAANPSDDSFTFLDSVVPNWASGTTVLLVTDDGASLPPQFSASNNVNIPYYVVRTSSNNSIKLAATAYDANRGIFIEFSQASTGNIFMQVYEKFEQHPYFTFAPFVEFLSIAHPRGLASNIFEGGNYVYGVDGSRLDSSQIFVNRRDAVTEMSLLGIVRNYNLNNPTTPVQIGGARVSIQAFEHVLSFNSYSVLGDLIYDAFLGLRTPRFLVEFGRQSKRTLRPTIGGYILNDGNLLQNIESAVDDSRYYYDDIRAEDGKVTTDIVRKALGYDGPKDYMSDIGINDKSQFLFWKAMIQNKGTNLAISAFANQSGLSGAEVDEFWAYKVAEFGGTEQLEYPEMKLLARDASRNELRLEFVPPNNTVLDSTFEPVALTDMARWWSQPDQIDSMRPYDTFFFGTKVNTLIENAEDKLLDIRGQKILVLPNICDSAIVTHVVNGVVTQLTEQSDFVFVNSRMIAFTTQQDPTTLEDLTVATLTYDFETQNPSKIIDRKSGTVVAEVPFWNPALGQYDLNYVGPINSMAPEDPALYTHKLDYGFVQEDNHWLGDRVGYIWMDTKSQGYVPYYDKAVMPNINDRIFNWGKLADWANIEVYQWTASKYTPEQWDLIAAQQDNDYIIPDEERISGRARKVLYKNVSEDPLTQVWVVEEDIHIDVIAGLMDSNNAPTLFGNIEVYVNGKFAYTRNISTVDEYLFIQDSLPVGTYLHFIKRAHKPTQQEIIEGLYVYDTPYVREKRVNPSSGNDEFIYYYWVSNKYNKIRAGEREYTLIGIKNGIINTDSPYMVVQGLRPPGAGYGLVYGNIFDEFGYELPYRYTQLVIKGLEGRIKDDERYTLRFTKDYNLRDRLDPTSLKKKNVHAEWKLFREKQSSKVDRYLWNKLIESVIGYAMVDDVSFNPNKQLPHLNRVVYDRIYGSDSRIGLADGQIFVDSSVAIATIRDVIDRDIFDYVNASAKDVLRNIDFSTPESAIVSLNNVYAVLDAEYVNKIFFAVLHDAMSLKSEYAEIFKTSWVALQISQRVTIPETEVDGG